jgi:hypothetical protein
MEFTPHPDYPYISPIHLSFEILLCWETAPENELAEILKLKVKLVHSKYCGRGNGLYKDKLRAVHSFTCSRIESYHNSKERLLSRFVCFGESMEEDTDVAEIISSKIYISSLENVREYIEENIIPAISGD